MKNDQLQGLIQDLRQFAKARDWDKYHSPKNLASSLVVEAGEVLEHFQWLSEMESGELDPAKKQEISLELADVFLYLLRLADKLDVDLLEAAQNKLVINGQKYPIGKSRGSNKKYTEL